MVFLQAASQIALNDTVCSTQIPLVPWFLAARLPSPRTSLSLACQLGSAGREQTGRRSEGSRRRWGTYSRPSCRPAAFCSLSLLHRASCPRIPNAHHSAPPSAPRWEGLREPQPALFDLLVSNESFMKASPSEPPGCNSASWRTLASTRSSWAPPPASWEVELIIHSTFSKRTLLKSTALAATADTEEKTILLVSGSSSANKHRGDLAWLTRKENTSA